MSFHLSKLWLGSVLAAEAWRSSFFLKCSCGRIWIGPRRGLRHEDVAIVLLDGMHETGRTGSRRKTAMEDHACRDQVIPGGGSRIWNLILLCRRGLVMPLASRPCPKIQDPASPSEGSGLHSASHIRGLPHTLLSSSSGPYRSQSSPI
jgi:hypothetical protein